MSIKASSPQLSKTQTKPDSRAHWITPEEQINRLRSPIAEKVSGVSLLIPNLAKIVAEYLGNESTVHWYTALKRLNALPKKIPPLPWNIDQILYSKCPIYRDQRKEDGTFYKVKDTHFLSLVPREFGGLNYLERNILKPYGEKGYRGENPLQFQFFWGEARQEHGNIAFRETHWVLMTKDVLPGSRNKSWNQQVALVDLLRKKALVNYEIPTLQESFAAITTNMVVTGERGYQSGNELNGDVSTYTRVKESTQGSRLVVGASGPSGVSVHGMYDFESVGVAALRKF